VCSTPGAVVVASTAGDLQGAGGQTVTGSVSIIRRWSVRSRAVVEARVALTPCPTGTARSSTAVWSGQGNVMGSELRPLELSPAKGTGECVHCDGGCGSYCRRCRRAVCAPCFNTHEGDHANWRERRVEWTRVNTVGA
jgi:hypothetical protein